MFDKVVVDDDKLSFIATFGNSVSDMEIVATLCAWMTNGYNDELSAIMEITRDMLNDSPTQGVVNWVTEDVVYDNCFFAILTNKCLYALLERLKGIYAIGSSLKCAYLGEVANHKYAHEAFASLLGGGTLFPTLESNCTFYRYNLLFYWLVYKLRCWGDVSIGNALLPCNDRVFDNAHRLGVTKKRLYANIDGAICLTKIARKWFGDNDFYKMYELLNYA